MIFRKGLVAWSIKGDAPWPWPGWPGLGVVGSTAKLGKLFKGDAVEEACLARLPDTADRASGCW